MDNGYSTECAPSPQILPVVEVIAHEKYNSLDASQLHDIALLRLGKKIVFNGNFF